MTFTIIDSIIIDGDTTTNTYNASQKGSYLTRFVNQANGSVIIVNHNYTVKLDARGNVLSYWVSTIGQGLGDAIPSAPSTAPNVHQAQDLIWDVQALRHQYAVAIDTNTAQGANGIYNLTAASLNSTETFHLTVDSKVGVPTSTRTALPLGMPLTTQFGNMTEIASGAWLPLNSTAQLSLQDGSTIQWGYTIANAAPNQGLNDSLFAVPAAPTGGNQ